jgi:uncharacterized protein (TIGR02246 family)
MISQDDEKAIRELGHMWEVAWNSHDMPMLASMMTPGVDFVHVMGGRLGGREIFQKYHAERHATQFKNSIHRTQGMAIRPLTSDICLAHVNWSNSGDTDPDGTPRQPREGIFTWIVRRYDAGWLIDAAQNTNINPQVVSAAFRKPTSRWHLC